MPSVDAGRQARRTRRRLVGTTVVTILVAANAIAFDPDERRLVVQLAFAALGLIAVIAAVGVLRRAAPLAPRSPLDRPPPRPRPGPPTPPADLVRVARRLEAAQASAADARRHLGPLVATIAADRLRDRAHSLVEPDSVFSSLPQPVAPELALVLDPALDDVDTRALPGLDAERADALVRALETL
ncbi:MAG TPA: hypothetical protein VH914_00460 [Acidimicrobiia bacterium]|jgi:hypothetical protein|nr:hypothetical protein [Acidimicrobiia bacterium]